MADQEQGDAAPPTLSREQTQSYLAAHLDRIMSGKPVPPPEWRRIRFDLPRTLAELRLAPLPLEQPLPDEPGVRSNRVVVHLSATPDAGGARAYCAFIVEYLFSVLEHVRAPTPVTTLHFVKRGAEYAQCVLAFNENAELAARFIFALGQAGIHAALAPRATLQPCATLLVTDLRARVNGGLGLTADDVARMFFENPTPQDVSVIEGSEPGVFYAAVRRPETVYAWLLAYHGAAAAQRDLLRETGILVTAALCEHTFLERGHHLRLREARAAAVAAAAAAAEPAPGAGVLAPPAPAWGDAHAQAYRQQYPGAAGYDPPPDRHTPAPEATSDEYRAYPEPPPPAAPVAAPAPAPPVYAGSVDIFGQPLLDGEPAAGGGGGGGGAAGGPSLFAGFGDDADGIELVDEAGHGAADAAAGLLPLPTAPYGDGGDGLASWDVVDRRAGGGGAAASLLPAPAAAAAAPHAQRAAMFTKPLFGSAIMAGTAPSNKATEAAAPPQAAAAVAGPASRSGRGWQPQWNAWFAEYPAAGPPFPPLPAEWTQHLSRSSGYYYFRRGRAGDATYRHPTTGREYRAAPQAFARDERNRGGAASEAALTRMSRQPAAVVRAWLADQRVRDAAIDGAALAACRVRYRSEEATATAAKRADAGESGGSGDDSDSSDADDKEAERGGGGARPGLPPALAERFATYPATEPPYPPLPRGWQASISRSHGLYYFRPPRGDKTYEHPVARAEFTAAPQAILREHRVSAAALALTAGCADEAAEQWLADQRRRDAALDAAALKMIGVSYAGTASSDKSRKRQRGRGDKDGRR